MRPLPHGIVLSYLSTAVTEEYSALSCNGEHQLCSSLAWLVAVLPLNQSGPNGKQRALNSSTSISIPNVTTVASHAVPFEWSALPICVTCRTPQYSRGPRFKSQPRDWLSWLRFSTKFLHASTAAVPQNLPQPLPSTKKLHGLSPRANYTDRATAACRRSDCQLLRIEGCHVVSVTDPYGRIFGFLDRSHYFSIK
jgi:hypothetical protein